MSKVSVEANETEKINQDVRVSVICKTYNQERYIRQCLESLVSQKTNFKYEIIVHDDASTDKTADIVREFAEKYSDLIVPIYQTENQYSKRVNTNLKFIHPILRGEYVAICEGDDFWTDENKLQIQFDYMNSNPECTLCCHTAYYANEDSSIIEDRLFRSYEKSCEIPMEELLVGWKMATNSIMYKFSARGNDVIPFQGDCRNGDLAQAVYLGLKGKIYYIDKPMSAYRVSSVGSLGWVWRSNFDLYRDSRTKYVEMLGRIDEYTNGKYHDVIKERQAAELFNMYVYVGDLKSARKYKDRFKKLPISAKVKLTAKHLFPSLYMKSRARWHKKKEEDRK